jgi:hypothetical protein
MWMQERRALVAAVAAAAWVLSAAIAQADVAANGPPVFVYKPNFNGKTSPGAAANTPSTFNSAALVFGSATPPSAALVSSASTFGGSPPNYFDITVPANLITGTAQIYPCSAFTNANGSQGCAAIAGSTVTSVNGVVATQSWPFYVGTSPSSNVNPGAFAFQTDSDDGSWLVLAPAPFTYAAPGNFAGASGLTAGKAVVVNSGDHSPAAVSGSASIASSAACASNVYWLTFEYYESLGGQAGFEYSWRPPGAAALGQVTQSVVYGQVSYNGGGLAGALVTIPLPSGGSTTVTTDANGCYGYNFTPSWTGNVTIGSLTATASGLGVTKTSAPAQIGEGAVTTVNFAIAPPSLTMYKRLTQITRAGSAITVPSDPSNPAGVLGAVSYTTIPGDILTYTIYYANAGDVRAVSTGSATSGPQITDPLTTTPLAYVAGSATATCSNPPAGNPAGTAAFASNTVTWSLTSPLPPAASGSVQGCVSFSASVP